MFGCAIFPRGVECADRKDNQREDSQHLLLSVHWFLLSTERSAVPDLQSFTVRVEIVRPVNMAKAFIMRASLRMFHKKVKIFQFESAQLRRFPRNILAKIFSDFQKRWRTALADLLG